MPAATRDGRRVECARGKVGGGSSSINALVYGRGRARCGRTPRAARFPPPGNLAAAPAPIAAAVALCRSAGRRLYRRGGGGRARPERGLPSTSICARVRPATSNPGWLTAMERARRAPCRSRLWPLCAVVRPAIGAAFRAPAADRVDRAHIALATLRPLTAPLPRRASPVSRPPNLFPAYRLA